MGSTLAKLFLLFLLGLLVTLSGCRTTTVPRDLKASSVGPSSPARDDRQFTGPRERLNREDGALSVEKQHFLAEYVESLRFSFRGSSSHFEDLALRTGHMHGAELLRARGIAGTEEEAEVYLDVSIEVERAKSPESHYATALVTIRGYDSGDGSLLYTAVEPSGPVLSRVSAEDAALNAVRGAVSVALPAAVRGARDAMRPHIQGGVPYRLFLRGDVSPRHRALLQRRLALIDPQVTRREHESESVYSLRYYGFRKDLISELRAIGDWNLRLLETKGNTVTFTKGSD